jgi:hypothetical protein
MCGEEPFLNVREQQNVRRKGKKERARKIVKWKGKKGVSLLKEQVCCFFSSSLIKKRRPRGGTKIE